MSDIGIPPFEISELQPVSACSGGSCEKTDHPLAQRLETALERLGAYFVDASPLQKAAVDIARRLTDLGIDYAIAGSPWLAADY